MAILLLLLLKLLNVCF